MSQNGGANAVRECQRQPRISLYNLKSAARLARKEQKTFTGHTAAAAISATLDALNINGTFAVQLNREAGTAPSYNHEFPLFGCFGKNK